jgi:hypothetical protein
MLTHARTGVLCLSLSVVERSLLPFFVIGPSGIAYNWGCIHGGTIDA